MDFSRVNGFSCNSFAVCGDRDEYAALLELERHVKNWNVTSFKTIGGCDHFYSGKLEQLHNIIEKILKTMD